ncbi:hypothetical protein IMG5_084070 [Ichthyophthirius multifiliis]|uniref:Uncharacterized protein n=1 Tax=Ichthyophthirius multifiliis TaxID=5932 RepID=G0QQU4_ICHMU|nr:hypothetical protein IMG5_084070 [Ichthyophthirius multifiliis]EGR32406.1 hypothetical protein IMG5_084070 [Ichthyophthirius multifiliis]|eukprot:XP_004036392.1 hypothetical protein IMG5_084070 [Ichthyophthirius multifiliis]
MEAFNMSNNHLKLSQQYITKVDLLHGITLKTLKFLQQQFQQLKLLSLYKEYRLINNLFQLNLYLFLYQNNLLSKFKYNLLNKFKYKKDLQKNLYIFNLIILSKFKFLLRKLEFQNHQMNNQTLKIKDQEVLSLKKRWKNKYNMQKITKNQFLYKKKSKYYNNNQLMYKINNKMTKKQKEIKEAKIIKNYKELYKKMINLNQNQVNIKLNNLLQIFNLIDLILILSKRITKQNNYYQKQKIQIKNLTEVLKQMPTLQNNKEKYHFQTKKLID